MTQVKEPPMTLEAERALQERNKARAEQAIARLGTRYACHPLNAPRRKSTYANSPLR